jgi:hypothetical protein
VQAALANVRTDLDSFSDVEADALMYSGYRMTEQEFLSCIPGFGTTAPNEENWRFLAIEPLARATRESPDLAKLRRTLIVAHEVWGKAFQLKLGAHWKYWLIGLAVVVLGAIAWWDRNWHPFPPIRLVAIVVVVALAIKVIEKLLVGFRYRNSVVQVVGSILLVLFGWLFLSLHLRLIDPIYLRYGPKYRKSKEEVPPSQKAANAGG